VCVTIEDSFCVVVVEGVSKAIRRYETLMTRRIDWSSTADEVDVRDATLEDGSRERRVQNMCTRVWSGTAARPSFQGKFRVETIRSLGSARKRFQDVGLAHFFDAAAACVAAKDEALED
jgi:U4/U6 small nuclear ribonucleoprotein PRP3